MVRTSPKESTMSPDPASPAATAETAENDATDATAATAATAARAEAQRKIVNRLRRAHGQLGAVIGAVESDAPCREVVQQLSAVSKALDRAGFLIVSTALKECLTNPENDELDAGELEKLFLSLA